MKDYSWEHLYEGQKASIELEVTAEDIAGFAKLSGDVSPIHVDEAFAHARGFPSCVAHGALLTAFVSRLIGTELPGSAGLLQRLEMQYRKPCFAGDTIRISGELTRKIDAVRTIQISIVIEDQTSGEIIANGKAQSGVANDARSAA